AVHALARAAAYGEWRRQLAGVVPHLADIDREAARRIVEEAGSGWLSTAQATRLLAAYGLPTVPCSTVTHAAEAVAAAEALGYPVALKVDAPVILHKTDVGAVALGLANATAVRATFNRMQRELAAERVVVEPMIEPGLEA